MFRPLLASYLLLAALTGCSPAAAIAGSPTAPSMRALAVAVPGLPAEVRVTPAQGAGPHPLLVIAPAKEYTMTGPIFESLASSAAAQGYEVVRFNWGFVSRKGQPSADLAVENAELEAVLKHFSAQPGVDNARVVLAAKSFGSRVAMRGAYRLADGFLLLTPNTSTEAPFERTYAPLFTYEKPMHVIMAATDPHGDIRQVYAAMGRLGAQATVAALPDGDHNFQVPGPRSARNVDTALASALNFLAFMRR